MTIEGQQPASQPVPRVRLQRASPQISSLQQQHKTWTLPSKAPSCVPPRRSTQFNPRKWGQQDLQRAPPPGRFVGGHLGSSIIHANRRCGEASTAPKHRRSRLGPVETASFPTATEIASMDMQPLACRRARERPLARQPWAPAPYDDGAGLDGGWEGPRCLSCWRYRRTRDGMTLLDGTSSR